MPCEVGQPAFSGCELPTPHAEEEEEYMRILAVKTELEMAPEWKISSLHCL